MQRAGDGSDRRARTLRAAALGLASSVLLLVGVGAAEALRFARGGFLLAADSTLVLLAGHALLGLVAAGVAAIGLLVGQRLVGWRGRRQRLWTVVVPTWTLFCVCGAVLNKLFFPAVASPAGIGANAVLAAAFLLLALVLWRWRLARRIGFWGLVAVPAVCLVAAAMARPAGAPPASGEPLRGPAPGARPRASIVLVTVDTLRADHLGAYGYGRPTSPALDELASRSVLFERAYSSSNWTRPAVASLLTSTLPSRHGVTDFHRALPAGLEILTESFRRLGYRTAIFAANPNVEPEDGYGRGTETFVRYSHRSALGRSFLFHQVLAKDLRPLETAIRWLLGGGSRPDYSPDALTESATDWLAEDDGPAFAYLHYAGPHDPYLPPEGVLRRLGGDRPLPRLAVPPATRAGVQGLSEPDRQQMMLQYDAEILWHDREIDRLVGFLEARAAQRDQVLVVTSDHGEAFGENGLWSHGVGMFDELTRIPLMIWCSKPCAEPRRVRQPVSLLDIAPTLLEMAGIPPPASYEGVSLLPLLRGETPHGDPAVVSENPKSRERSIRTKDWLWFEDRTPGHEAERLVALSDDRPEEGSEAWESLRARLRSMLEARLAASRELAAAPVEVELGQDRIEELRALGYLQ